MAATPKNGTMTFVGRSGRSYAVDVYVSDVAAQTLRFNPAGAAGSNSTQFWKCPEDVVLVDWALATGTADTTNVTMTADDAPIAGGVLRYAQFVNTIATRPNPNIGFRAGRNVSGYQAA